MGLTDVITDGTLAVITTVAMHYISSVVTNYFYSMKEKDGGAPRMDLS